MAVVEPDLSKRPLGLTAERTMVAAPAVLSSPWTEQFDRWCAAPETVPMQGRVDTATFFETHLEGRQHPPTADSCGWSRGNSSS